MRFINLLLAGGGLFLVSALYAQEPFDPVDTDTSLLHFPAKLLNDLPDLWGPGNIPILAVGTAATALDWTTLDGRNALAADLQELHWDGLFDFGDFYGEGWVEGGGALGSWTLGALDQDRRLQEFGRDATESLVTTTLLVTGLKYAVGRERPNHLDHLSFPSGHAATAFCFAPVVDRYGGRPFGIAAYALATVTALARVEGYHHYLSDVIAGATLGIVVGNACTSRPAGLSVGLGPGEVFLTGSFD